MSNHLVKYYRVYPMIRIVNKQMKTEYIYELTQTMASSPVKLLGYSVEQNISLDSHRLLILDINPFDTVDM